MKTRLLTGFVVVLALAVLTIAADDPFVGTWKLNVEKSTFPAGRAQKSATLKQHAQANGNVKIIWDGVYADGKTGHLEFVTKYDGKDCPCTGDPSVDTCSARRIDAHNQEAIQKKAGKVIWKAMITVSKDGQTQTFKEQTKNATGQDVTTITVYDKQ